MIIAIHSSAALNIPKRLGSNIICETHASLVNSLLFSEKPFLRKPLEDYWKAMKLDHIVKVVRTK